MATFLDVGLLQAFDVLFAFLFILVLIFAILQKVKAVSSSVSINAIIAVMVALLSIISDTLVQIINFMIPWFVILFVFVILLLMLFQVFGAKEGDFASAVKSPLLMWIVIGVAFAILAAAVINVVPDNIAPYLEEGDNATSATGDGSTTTNSFSSNLLGIIFNPKVIGLIVIFLVAVFAIALLSSGP